MYKVAHRYGPFFYLKAKKNARRAGRNENRYSLN